MKESKDSANSSSLLRGQAQFGLAGGLKLQKGFALGLAALWMLALLFSPIDPNYTSGELLDHAHAFTETGTLYSSPESAPYRILNYPPLFFILIRGLTVLGLPIKMAGHLIVWTAVLGALALMNRWLRLEIASRSQRLATLSLLGASYAFLSHAALFHIQWPAVFLSLAGLFLLKKPEHLKFSFLAGILLGLACFVKQTQVLSALIALVWLLRYHLKHALFCVGGLLLVGAGGGWGIQAYFGPEAWRQMITDTVGSYSLLQGMREGAANLLPWIFFFLLALRWAFENSEHRRDLRTWYLVGSTLGLLSVARVGSGAQYFVEWNCAVVFCLSALFQEKSPLLRPALFAIPLFLIQLIVADAVIAGRLTADSLRLKDRLSLLPSLCAKLSPVTAYIPIGEPGLARACGKIPALHPFIMAELAKKGLWSEKPFLKELEDGAYPMAVLPFDPAQGPRGFDRERWTPAMVDAFRKNYQVSEDGKGWRVLEYVRNRE